MNVTKLIPFLTPLAIGIFMACAKSGSKPATTIQTEETVTQASPLETRSPCSDGTKMRHYWTVIGDCDVPAMECFPDIIVSPHRIVYKDQFEDAINKGSAAIANFFENENGLQLFEYLNCTQADGAYNLLISGNCNITKNVNDQNESNYLLYLNGNPELKYVMVLK